MRRVLGWVGFGVRALAVMPLSVLFAPFAYGALLSCATSPGRLLEREQLAVLGVVLAGGYGLLSLWAALLLEGAVLARGLRRALAVGLLGGSALALVVGLDEALSAVQPDRVTAAAILLPVPVALYELARLWRGGVASRRTTDG